MSAFGRKKILVLILSVVLLLTCQSVFAQQESPATKPRPRIGLALSGGGARGLAHIGVIKWMEENHIPVDYVAGTSMGALVGSLYATGMSSQDMETFVEHVDWDEALLSEPEYRQLSFRRKEDRRGYKVGIPLGLKRGLSSPNGFNPGHGVALLLDRIAFPYSTIPTFDDLPTPFRCVATNMLDGSEVVLKDGSLGQSLRATMAVPGVFTPVELDGKILADGGLVDNIPTDVVRGMHADVVIGVDIGTPLAGADDLQSLGGVLQQTISVMTLANQRLALQKADIVVAPDLGPYSSFDFYSAKALIRLGYEGAERNAAKLRAYAVGDAEWQQYLTAREGRKRQPEKVAKALDVTGVTGPDKVRLEEKLEKTVKTEIDTDSLETKLTRITGEGRFDSLGYEGFVQNGVPGLMIVAHEKTYGPPFVDLALNVNGSGVGAFDFGAGARITFMDVRKHGGEWRNDLMLGSSALAGTEFYQPLGTSHLFVAPYAFFSKVARNAFSGSTRTAVYADERGGGGVDLGYNSGRSSELRVGYQIFNGDLFPLIGSAGLPRVGGSNGEFRLRYVYDDQDSPAVPSSGIRLQTDLTHVLQSPGVAHAISQLQVQSSSFVPISEKNSLFVNASFGLTSQGDAGPFQLYALGGPFRLSAYSQDEFLGNYYGYTAVGFRREFYRLPQLVGKKVYWAAFYEAGSAFNNPSTFVVRGSMNLGVIADTIVGPVTLGGSVSPTGLTRINFSIGRIF